MEGAIRFFVPGIPRTAGSKRGFVNPRNGRVIITEDNKRSKDWRASVALVASDLIRIPLEGPLSVTFEFQFMRPKGHYGSKGLRSSAPLHPAVRPDLLKVARSTEDAMSGIAYRDDAQIVHETLIKRYGEQAGAWITIEAWTDHDCFKH
jgi:Holliday junction resolvase RusA-like endonuclease